MLSKKVVTEDKFTTCAAQKNGLVVEQKNYQKENGEYTVVMYKNGLKHGWSITYDIDGNVVKTGRYKQGEKHGKWKWYPKCRLAVIWVYKKGVMLSRGHMIY